MPSDITIRTTQLVETNIQIDLSDHFRDLEIDLDDDDVDGLMAQDPDRCFEYLLNYHWEEHSVGIFVRWAKENFTSAELLSLCSKLVNDEEESAA